MKLLIVLHLFCGAMAQARANDLWQTYNSRSYVYNSTPATWANAQLHCLTVGGHLAVINNQNEENYVKALAKGQDAWIGLSDAQENNHWFWVNSQPLGYINWCPGEPNNSGNAQNCALTNFSARKCWDDQRCDRLHPYVCEKRIARTH